MMVLSKLWLLSREHIMSFEDMKIGFMNAISLGISFTPVEQWLKVSLLIVSIVYTVLKIIEMKKVKNK